MTPELVQSIGGWVLAAIALLVPWIRSRDRDKAEVSKVEAEAESALVSAAHDLLEEQRAFFEAQVAFWRSRAEECEETA